jgi:hypothetical protein
MWLITMMPGAMPVRASARWPLRPVLGACILIAMLMSMQYLVQPFVWRNWPWDDVLAGWLDIARDRIVVATCIGIALVAASRLPLATSRGRAVTFGAAILGMEIDLASAYLGVVAQRMDGRLALRLDVSADLRGEPFPALTIATLVENAVKHGIAPAPGGGTISVTARRQGRMLQVEVADTGVGFSGTSGSGIGLANIRARLSALYGLPEP